MTQNLCCPEAQVPSRLKTLPSYCRLAYNIKVHTGRFGNYCFFQVCLKRLSIKEMRAEICSYSNKTDSSFGEKYFMLTVFLFDQLMFLVLLFLSSFTVGIKILLACHGSRSCVWFWSVPVEHLGDEEAHVAESYFIAVGP